MRHQLGMFSRSHIPTQRTHMRHYLYKEDELGLGTRLAQPLLRIEGGAGQTRHSAEHIIILSYLVPVMWRSMLKLEGCMNGIRVVQCWDLKKVKIAVSLQRCTCSYYESRDQTAPTTTNVCERNHDNCDSHVIFWHLELSTLRVSWSSILLSRSVAVA